MTSGRVTSGRAAPDRHSLRGLPFVARGACLGGLVTGEVP